MSLPGRDGIWQDGSSWGRGRAPGADVVYETPTELANRLRLGREALLQRLLTSLILDGPYPPWNTRSTASPHGIVFLRSLWDLSGFGAWPSAEVVFVDEFDLPRRTDDERGGAPDYALLWDDRLWMIELKTEAASHRRDQIPSYFELARHHHPDHQLDITYVTPPLSLDSEPQVLAGRFAHVTWDAVAPLITAAWPEPTAQGQQQVVDGLADAIGRLSEPPSQYLDSLRTSPAVVPPIADPATEGISAAEATAGDGRQRALDHAASGLEDLQALRLECRDALAGSPPDSPLRRVRPWLWTTATGGRPMTAAGEHTGAELRFSRYRNPLY